MGSIVCRFCCFAAEPQGGDFGSLWWASDLSNVTTSHSHCHRPFLDPKLVLRQSMLSMSDSSSSDYSDEESAIEWLLSQQGNQLLVRVDEDYIEDAFNLYGLNKVIPNFRDTLRLLLTTAEEAEICLEDDHRGPCYQTLLDLYGLIHARYILTTPGMNKLRRKLQNGVYGCCPTILISVYFLLGCQMCSDRDLHLDILSSEARWFKCQTGGTNLMGLILALHQPTCS